MAVIGKIETQNPAQTVVLGTLELTAESYRLQTECPVINRTLCDGNPHCTVLAPRRCVLTFSGRIVTGEGAEILRKLSAAMQRHTPFSFSLADCSFTGMQITELLCKVEQLAYTTAYTITMIGSMREESV